MTVLIIGATGRVAAHLSRRLLANGKTRVRALVRNAQKARAAFADAPDLEIVEGAFDDPVVLKKAFDDVDTVFLALGTSQQQVPLEKGLIDAAAKFKVPHLVRLSVFGADPAGSYEIARRHGELDTCLAASGVPHTLLRPSFFSSNLLLRGPSIASSDRWSGVATDGRIAMIDTRDVGDAAAAVILDPALRNVAHDLTGPVTLSYGDAAEVFSRVLERPIAYVPVAESVIREGYAARGVPDWLIDLSIGIDRAMQNGEHATLTQELQALTGQPPRPLELFVRDHRAAFSPAG